MMEVVPIDYYPLVDRSKMPQIDLRDLPNLLVFLGQRRITFKAGVIQPERIKLHQEVDVARAMALPDVQLARPVLLSRGRFVLDGDHRAYRHWVNKTLVPFIQLNVGFSAAIKALLSYPGTYTES